MRLTEGRLSGSRSLYNRAGFMASVTLITALRYLPATVGLVVAVVARLAGASGEASLGFGVIAFGLAMVVGGDLWARSRALSGDLGQAERVRFLWPRICSHNGWTSKTVGDPDVIRCPLLVDVHFRGPQGVIAFRPLGDQTPESWEVVSEAFRRSLGAHSVRVHESPQTPGVLVASVSMAALPSVAHAPVGVGP